MNRMDAKVNDAGDIVCDFNTFIVFAKLDLLSSRGNIVPREDVVEAAKGYGVAINDLDTYVIVDSEVHQDKIVFYMRVIRGG